MNNIAPIKQIQHTLASMDKQFTSVLPAQIPTNRFLRTATMAIEQHSDKEKILNADRETLYAACMKAAQDGLMLDNREAALTVFNKKVNGEWVPKVQYMPMVSGIIKKALQSNQISSLSAHVVKENDQFDYWVDEDGTHFTHRPELKTARGDSYMCYAIAKMKDGAIQMEVMNKEEIEKVRMTSKTGKDKSTGEPAGIWKQWPDEMWKKTVLRRLCKYLPSSSELDNVFESDNRTFDIQPAREPANEPITAEPSTQEKKTRAQQIIEAQAKDNIQDSKATAIEGDII